MQTESKSMITIKTTVEAPVTKVWKYWTKPEHIVPTKLYFYKVKKLRVKR
ncbi:MAG: hypothetical protein ABIR03_02965 [Ginsengibacter sp.]